MNHLIKEQLDSCRVANVPYYDDNITTIVIPKGSSLTVSPYQVHKCYVLEVADWVIHPSEDSTLASNWNGGSSPTCRYYAAEIIQVVGKMIKITGCGFDIETDTSNTEVWDGWIPQKGLRIVKEL